MDFPASQVGVLQLRQGVDEDVDTLVAVLVAAADAHEHGAFGHLRAAHGGSDGNEPIAGLRPLGLPLLIRSRSETVLESVGGHDVHRTPVELLALACGDVADSGENVGVACGHLLERMTGDDTEASRHLVAVIAFEILV